MSPRGDEVDVASKLFGTSEGKTNAVILGPTLRTQFTSRKALLLNTRLCSTCTGSGLQHVNLRKTHMFIASYRSS